MARRKNRDRHRRRGGRFGGLYKLLSLLVILLAIGVGCVAFFRVNEVVVVGNSRYTAQEIAAASGVEKGDNLFLVNRPQTIVNIQRKLPYVSRGAVVVRPPDVLELRIVESVAVAAVDTEEGRWLLSSGCKLLELSGGEELPTVLGLTPQLPSLGSPLAVTAEEQRKLDALKALLAALEERGLCQGLTGFIDLSAMNSIYFGYGEGLTVEMPMTGDFQRLAFSLERVAETFAQRGEQITGTLDLTYGSGEARLLPDRWLPVGWQE